jgi:hypothetical protein
MSAPPVAGADLGKGRLGLVAVVAVVAPCAQPLPSVSDRVGSKLKTIRPFFSAKARKSAKLTVLPPR